jgi:hypothetical protein
LRADARPSTRSRPKAAARRGDRSIFRTDRHGDIEISTDGERLWVEVEREGE